MAARGPRAATPTPAPGGTPVPPAGRVSVTALDRFSSSLPPPLRRVPPAALLSWVGLGAASALVLVSLVVRDASAVSLLEAEEGDAGAGVAAAAAVSGAPVVSGAPGARSAAAAPVKPHAEAGALEAARQRGAAALGALAERFPEDPAVLKALFLAQAGEKKGSSAALRTARRLLDVDAAEGDDAEVRAALLGIANGPQDTAAVALDVMAGEMGSRGADLLFEVSTGPNPLSKVKALALLKDADVRRHATPGVLIAADLAHTLGCARKSLLGRAKADGDARSLPYLKPLLNTVCGGGGGGLRGLFGGGGKSAECYRCFTAADRAAIEEAIGAIEGRSPDAGGSSDLK